MEPNDDECLDMVGHITQIVLTRIGDDPNARYQFFKQFVELAREVAPVLWYRNERKH